MQYRKTFRELIFHALSSLILLVKYLAIQHYFGFLSIIEVSLILRP